MDPKTTSGIEDGVPSFKDLPASVCRELAAVQKTRAAVMARWDARILPTAILALCVLINILFFLFRTDYFGLFIAASFYLNMYYFLILLIPTRFEWSGPRDSGISRFRAWIRAMGVTSGTSQFARLFTNTVFMNSHALSPAIGLIFAVDILFSLLAAIQGLPFRTTVIVIVQCSMITLFYLMVWSLEPFTSEYARKVDRARISLRRLPPQLIAGIIIFGFILAISLFLVTIIFLPGVTLKAFLVQSELAALGHLFGLLAILAVSQYFPLRFIHGLASRRLAERLFDYRVNRLHEILQRVQELPAGGDSGDDTGKRELGTLLTESRIYIVKRKTIAGSFPVFVIDLDFHALMDITKLTATRGYIMGRKAGS